MSVRTIHQALYTSDSDGVRLDASTDGFDEAWGDTVRGYCAAFGRPTDGVSCPEAVFALPMPMHERIIVGQVTDTPGQALRFRLLVLTRPTYRIIGDPFLIAERFPADWTAKGELPDLEWPDEPLPARTLERAREALQHGDSVALLGATQALLDGGKVALRRSSPDPVWMRNLWTLLPDAARARLWPATFAFSEALPFDIVAVPEAVSGFERHLTEEQIRDYPEGRYELALQVAVESGDHREFARLLARRTMNQALLQGVLILVGTLAVLAAMQLLDRLLHPR